MGRVAGVVDGIMATRAGHFRTIANMPAHGALAIAKLYPTGQPTLAKAWIERGESTQTYRITCF
jgi:hypothetical protein